tara:strand:- start:95 stop:676 length:582 start_codon:yes stop_codon:yes gene_type:complete
MNKKILVFVCCVVLVFKTIKSQVVSVEGVQHADTVQYAAPFSLGFWFVNTGNAPILDSVITANIVICPANSPLQNGQLLTFVQEIPQGIFAPGDSIFIDDLNAPLNGGPQLYQQAGDNLVVIWPSFVVPATIDTSITPLYVIPPTTSINEIISPINKAPSYYIYDILGRRYDNINDIPIGSMYIRDGKKYIKK